MLNALNNRNLANVNWFLNCSKKISSSPHTIWICLQKCLIFLEEMASGIEPRMAHQHYEREVSMMINIGSMWKIYRMKLVQSLVWCATLTTIRLVGVRSFIGWPSEQTECFFPYVKYRMPSSIELWHSFRSLWESNSAADNVVGLTVC